MQDVARILRLRLRLVAGRRTPWKGIEKQCGSARASVVVNVLALEKQRIQDVVNELHTCILLPRRIATAYEGSWLPRWQRLYN